MSEITYSTESYTYSYVASENESSPDTLLVHAIQRSKDCDMATASYDDNVKHRGTWAHKIDFILSVAGYAIGYGNVWRFPYLAYTHGGGTFLIPYFTMLAFVGFPIFFMEIALGQYCGVGPTYIFQRMAPIVSGLGYSMCIRSFMAAISYVLILTYSTFYLFSGVAAELPWTTCGKSRPLCYDSRNLTSNTTELLCHPNCVWAAEDFYRHTVLGQEQGGSSWCDYGDINWTIVFCHLFAWTLVASAVFQGIRSSTKFVYFTVPFPVIVLLILGCQCLTLDGVGDGISYYVKTDFSKLIEPIVWVKAATQVFYSLSIGFGAVHTLASYNQFNNNCFQDALIVSISDSLVSIIAGFVIFGMIGFIAKTGGQDIKSVVNDGPNLAFVTLPDAISQMPAPHFWSFISFSMLVTLGLDTLFASVENTITTILDHNTWLRQYRSSVVMAVTFTGFILGVSMCAPQGYAMFVLIDSNVNGWNVLLLVVFEAVSVSWVYGAYNFWECIEEMGMKLNDYIKHYLILCWLVITPMLLCFLLTWNFYCQIMPTQGFCQKSEASKRLPAIAVIGHLLGVTPLVFIPIFAIKELLKLLQMDASVSLIFYPTMKWGPCKDKSHPRKKMFGSDFTSFTGKKGWPPIIALPPHWDPEEILAAPAIGASAKANAPGKQETLTPRPEESEFIF